MPLKLLLVTNMRPSPQKPYSGIFVQNQYKRLKEDPELKVSLFTMERTFTSPLGSVIKYVKAFFSFIPHYFKKYEVIHLHYFFPLILCVYIYKLLNPKCHMVVTFHGSDIEERITKGNAPVFNYLAGCIDYVIAVSDELAGIIYKKLSLKTDLVLSAGVDERTFYFKPNTKKKYHFTYASSFIKRKGMDLYLQAIRKYGNKNVRYCFIGTGELEKDIRELMSEYDIELKLNLTQDEMCQVFNESYFHVLPSRFEPFGLVVTESMFCGIPTIGSTTGGIRSQINHGVNGFILEKLEVSNIADTMSNSIDTLSNGEYDSLHEHCLASNKKHSLSQVIQTTKSIYFDFFDHNSTISEAMKV